MRSRMFVLGLAVVVIVSAEIILFGAPSRVNLVEHEPAVMQPATPLIEVRQGHLFGESEPLVPGHESLADEVLPIPDENAAPYVAAEDSEDFSANEHSVLISSKVELVEDAADDDDADLQQSERNRERERDEEQERERRMERTRDRELEEGEEGEEEEEEMPPNSVAQGNRRGAPTNEQMWAVAEGSAAVEQTTMGTKEAAKIIASFDGLGAGFEGPQGRGRGGNPSDNSLAVGPDHVVVTVNSTMAIFAKKGKKYNESGKPLYGPVNTNNVFRGCEICGDINNGDAVVRYDQLADRWLVVMPIFRRLPYREDQPPVGKAGEPAQESQVTNKEQPGPAIALFQPPSLTAEEREAAAEEAAARRGARRGARGEGGAAQRRGRGGDGTPPGPYAMCYAISTGPDPLGTYYRYHFVRPLFPDYPRPAVWPDGYYNPSSTGDNRISDTVASQKHACVVERQAMLEGKPAREQCLIIENVNFLNNADLDGKELPPPGAPNIMMASGGTQLDGDLDDDGIYYWKMHVDWNDPTKTKAEGPVKIAVAPYNYMSGGQLSRGGGVPQKGSETRLDTQGDKIMSRLVYRRIGNQESIVAVHSINSTGGGGGVRWYEFRVDDPTGKRDVKLHQQGTYMPAPEGTFRWMASPAIDKFGNIGIGYSFGGKDYFPGQRFAGRQPNDPLGQLTLKESVLIEGQAAQEPATRWQDYVATAVDPDDDCTIWYVGDYVKEGNRNYSSRVGAFRMPGCGD